MTLRHKTAKGALLLAGGKAAGQALGFARNVIVARLLGPEDFGIAAIFAVTMSFLEMLSDLGTDRLLVQAEDGDDPRLQATAQLIQAVRGLVLGLLLFAVAGPIASIFDAEEAVWAFQMMALLPAIRGLAHLDVKRAHRDLAFAPATVADVGSQAVAVAAAYPIGAWLGDYSVALWLLLLQSTAYVLATHGIAERRYLWRWEPDLARRFVQFGWPLLMNGGLLFLILQSDRLAIGSALSSYSAEDLGIYSAALVLAMAPSALLATLNQSLLLPLLSSSQNDRAAFLSRYRRGVEASAAVGVAMALGLIAVTDLLVPRLYGAAYAPAAAVLPWLAFSQAARIVRMGPTVAAMALGDTQNLMWSNVARACAVPLVVLTAWSGAGLPVLAACGLGGELVAAVVASVGLQRRHGIDRAIFGRPSMLAAAVIAACGIAPSLVLSEASSWYRLPVVIAVAALGMTVFVWRSAALHPLLGNVMTALRRRPPISAVLERPG